MKMNLENGVTGREQRVKEKENKLKSTLQLKQSRSSKAEKPYASLYMLANFIASTCLAAIMLFLSRLPRGLYMCNCKKILSQKCRMI